MGKGRDGEGGKGKDRGKRRETAWRKGKGYYLICVQKANKRKKHRKEKSI